MAAVAAVILGLGTAGCTRSDPSPTPSPSTSPSMTFEEAYQRVPINGVGDLRISWEVPTAADGQEVLSARRSLAYTYWLSQAADWTPVIPYARFLFTERYYQAGLSGFETARPGKSMVGPIWIKFLGTEQLAPDQVRVTFCVDLGHWHQAPVTDMGIRKYRASLESMLMVRTTTGDGERRWLADRHYDNDGDREARYGAQCTKWAQHTP